MSPSGSTFAKGWFPNPQGGRTTTAAFLRQRANRDAFEGKELLEPWVLPHLGEEWRVPEVPRVECMVLRGRQHALEESVHIAEREIDVPRVIGRPVSPTEREIAREPSPIRSHRLRS